MQRRAGRFLPWVALWAGLVLPVFGQTTHQPFLGDVAALARAQAQAAAQACVRALAQASA